MFTMDSLVFLAIAVAILFAAVQRGGDGARTMSEKTHRAICGAAIAAGVLVRLARRTSLPAPNVVLWLSSGRTESSAPTNGLSKMTLLNP